MAGQRVTQAAGWPRLAEARGSLEHDLALKTIEGSGAPAGRGLSHFVLHIGAPPPFRPRWLPPPLARPRAARAGRRAAAAARRAPRRAPCTGTRGDPRAPLAHRARRRGRPSPLDRCCRAAGGRSRLRGGARARACRPARPERRWAHAARIAPAGGRGQPLCRGQAARARCTGRRGGGRLGCGRRGASHGGLGGGARRGGRRGGGGARASAARAALARYGRGQTNPNPKPNPNPNPDPNPNPNQVWRRAEWATAWRGAACVPTGCGATGGASAPRSTQHWPRCARSTYFGYTYYEVLTVAVLTVAVLTMAVLTMAVLLCPRCARSTPYLTRRCSASTASASRGSHRRPRQKQGP